MPVRGVLSVGADEIHRSVRLVEGATGGKVVVVEDEVAQEAAGLAARISFSDRNPYGEWVDGGERVEVVTRLLELIAVKDFKPFDPERCPLTVREVEEAVDYLRESVRVYARAGKPCPESIKKFVPWARGAATGV